MAPPRHVLHLVSGEVNISPVQDALASQSLSIASLTLRSLHDLRQRLHQKPASLIIVQSREPGLDVFHALELVRMHQPGVPMIVVTDTLDDQSSLQLIETGVFDVIRSDRTARCAAAIGSALAIELPLELKQARSCGDCDDFQQTRHQGFFNLATIGMGHANPVTGQLIDVNDCLCQITGYTRSELLAMTFSELTHPEDRAADFDQFQKMVRGETSHHAIEKRYIRKDGREIWVQVNATIMRDKQGNPIESAAVIQDISERKRAEAERAILMRDLKERVKEIGALYGMSQLLQRANDSVQELLDRIVSILPGSWQHSDVAAARIVYGSDQSSTPGFQITPWVLHAEFTTADGTQGWIEVAYLEQRPDCDHGPFLKEEQCLIVSLTEMLRNHLDRLQASQKVQASEERFRTLVANLPGAVYRCYFDDYWTMLYLSDAVEKITGYPATDFIGNTARNFSEIIIPQDNQRNHSTVTQAIRRGETYQLEYRLHHADGSERWIYEKGKATLNAQGEVQYLDGAIFDITDRKRHEAVEQERNTLRKAIEAHERVLGVVGHELRTPLAATRAMAEFLLSEQADDQAQMQNFLHGIHDETVRMSGMVNDLLEVARLNNGTERWNWDTVSVADVCHSAINEVRDVVDESQVELQVRIEPEDMLMRGDSRAIRRLVLNLLTNACKHTPKGSINVRVRSIDNPQKTTTTQFTFASGPSVSDENWIEIQVADTGSGISDSTVDRLGEAFALNSGVIGENHVGGAGLGLSICRGIAWAHGGTMSVATASGRGSTFTVRLRADLPEPVTGIPALRIEQEALR